MAIWNDCKAEDFGTNRYYQKYECVVRITGKKIYVAWKENKGMASYRGKYNNAGYYELEYSEGGYVASHEGGTATLHKFGNIFYGDWKERSYRGVWRIELWNKDD